MSSLRTQIMEPLRGNSTLLMVCVATGIIMLGQGAIVPVLPLYAEDFEVSATMVGATISVFGLARVLLNLPAGILSDRVGRQVMLVGGAAITSIGYFLSALAGDIWQLLTFRFVAGAGSALFMTSAMTLVTDISTTENRGRMLSYYQGSLLLGVSIGPALGGLVAELFGLRAPFIVVGMLAAVCVLWALRERPAPVTHVTSVPEAVDEQRQPVPIAALLTNLGFTLASLVTFAIFFTRTGSRQSVLALFGNESLGLTAGALGAIFAMMALLNLAAIGPSGVWSDRYGRKAVIVPSALVASAGLVLFAFTDSIAVFIIAAIVTGIGTGLGGSAPAAYAADVVPAEARGVGMGLYRTYGDVGFVLGPVLLGWIIDATDSFSWALMFNAVLMAGAAIAFGLFARETVGRKVSREESVARPAEEASV
jgi:MFS family permease